MGLAPHGPCLAWASPRNDSGPSGLAFRHGQAGFPIAQPRQHASSGPTILIPEAAPNQTKDFFLYVSKWVAEIENRFFPYKFNNLLYRSLEGRNQS